MLNENILLLQSEAATLEKVGGKGASLAKLARAGLPVPDGFFVTTDAYERFVAENGLQETIQAALADVDPERPSTLEQASKIIRERFMDGAFPDEIAQAVTEAYAGLSGINPHVAVRSSATAEDLPEASFAGQQETFLNVSGPEAVLEATRKCWASLWTGRAIGYRAKQGAGADTVALSVVVQILVPAEAAGILFTANPVDGNRREAVINAAWGLGEAVVGGAVNPDTLVIDKASGEVIQRETAEKQVMTVRVDGGTEERPTPEPQRQAQALNDENAVELAKLGEQIEQLFGMPMDIEWALEDGNLYILQARPITALPEPRTEPPSEWPVPSRKARYLRNNIVELMPDPLTPLFSTLGRNTINRVLKRVINDFMGRDDLLPDELIITINGYAYYSGEFTGRQIGLLMWNSIGIMRRMFTGMEERWQAARPQYFAVINHWQSKQLAQLPSEEILTGVQDLLHAAISYYAAIVSGLIPAAWISEAIFTQIYKRLIKRKQDPEPAVYLLGFDSKPILAEKALYDLAECADGYPELAQTLLETPSQDLSSQIKDGVSGEIVHVKGWEYWKKRFHEYLSHYGGMLYDLDFAKPTPAGDPAPVLETFKLFLRGQGTNPYERQKAAAERRERAIRETKQRLGRLRLSWFEKTLHRAQKYAPLREDGLAELGAGYPLLREYLLELGRRFAAQGAIQRGDDIFWLGEHEVRQAINALQEGALTGWFADQVAQRKAEWRAQKSVTPPFALPLRGKARKAGRRTSKGTRRGETQLVLKGVACSAGKVSGTARVLEGPQDFDQMQPGDVLVARITTPAWTPLFAMASAIVTDVGGPLNHGSIVAREYNIPAVLGAGSATSAIQSGQTVTVDGTEGKVYLERENQPTEQDELSEWPMPDPKGRYMRTSIVDFMPNPLSPLFATLGTSIYNDCMQQMMADLTDSKKERFPGDLIVTIRDYAYMKTNFSAGEWWAMLIKLAPRIPRLIRKGPEHFQESALPEYREKVAHLDQKPVEDMTAVEIWKDAHTLTSATMYHMSVLQVDTLGAAAGSEGSFTAVYERWFRREGDPPAAAFVMGYDSIPIRAEKSLYDLAQWAKEHSELQDYLLDTDGSKLVEDLSRTEAPAEVDPSIWADWKQRIDEHLKTYGHILYDLDFAEPVPAEDPAPQLETVRMYLRGEGSNPHERQEQWEQRRIQATQDLLARARGLKGWAVRKTLGWAQSVGAVREDSIASIGLAYPRLRELLKELGRRMAAAGVIREPEDIFLLQRAEIEERLVSLGRGDRLEPMDEVIGERKEKRQAEEELIPPAQLPPSDKYMGIPIEAFIPGEGAQEGDRLKGVGASGGQVTGVACVLHGPEDFDQMVQGGILVAKLTTPAWTPLFAMAGGVVTDIGGPLSHGSIVAREYGIPAVLGTGAASRMIQSGQRITVDGTEGVVILEGG